MFKSLIFRLVRSKRVILAIFGNGMVSLSSFALTVSVARISSVPLFASFSLAMVTYLFSSGLIKAAFTNTALSRPTSPSTFNRSLQRSSLLAIGISLIIFTWGMVSDSSFLLILGLSLHPLLILDFLRTYDSASGNKTRAFTVTLIWSLTSLSVSLTSLVTPVDPLIIFSTWAFSGALIGYILAAVSKVNILPIWPKDRVDTETSATFTADYLVGAGGGQITTGLLGFLDDSRILSAIRGSGTLLGPINLISTTARSLMLPFLARELENPNRQIRSAVAAVVIQAVPLVPLLLVLQFIPDQLGEQFLGDTWEFARLAILPMSIDALFNVIMAPAISGHRVAFAGMRSLLLRILIGVPRPFIVLFSAYTWGITGAAWAMASIAITGSIIWWVSYYDLSRRALRKF